MVDTAKKESWLARLDHTLERKIPELWKFIKWAVMGGLASAVELGVHYLLEYVFRDILTAPITNIPDWLMGVLEFARLTKGRGFLYAYLISITVGYAIAYVLNRKISFKSNANIALSTTLYVIMVVFIVLTGAWIGATLSDFLIGRDLERLTFLVKPLQMVISGLWTYPINRFVIYRRKKEEVQA